MAKFIRLAFLLLWLPNAGIAADFSTRGSSHIHIHVHTHTYTLPVGAPGIGNRLCIHEAPYSVVCFVPDQGLTGFGSANLKSPTGGSAYGIPRYWCAVLPCGRVSTVPTIAPDSV